MSARKCCLYPEGSVAKADQSAKRYAFLFGACTLAAVFFLGAPQARPIFRAVTPNACAVASCVAALFCWAKGSEKRRVVRDANTHRC